MQEYAIVINKVIGTKDQGHTCLYPESSCSDCLQPLALQSFSDNVPFTQINHRAQGYTKQTNKQTKNNTPVKRKALKEHTKG
jgi:hypothetical protein